MSTGNEAFENLPIREPSPLLSVYLEAHQDVDPSRVVSLNHIPPLIGGLKSRQFIIQEQGASSDTSPDSNARIDLSKTIVPSHGLAAFAEFFKQSEAQADAQYEAALFETQQFLAAANDRGVEVEMLFIPDTVNSTAKDYFRRLTRLAQDTGIKVALRVVDREDGDIYQSFKHFEPVRASSASAYWEQRASESRVLTDPLIYLGDYAVYTMEGAYKVEGPPAADALAAIALPAISPPFVFTSFEQVQKDYPNSPISDPAVWEARKDNYELVADEAAYFRVDRARTTERDTLLRNMRHAAKARTEELRQLLIGSDSLLSDKLPVIRELAADSDYWNVAARMILAKLGDTEGAQIILQEIQDKTGGWGNESLTIAPLGIHLRHDEQLFGTVIDQVKSTIAEDPDSSHRLLSLLGALYHSHDLRVAGLLAGHLMIPTRHIEAYASTVLHAAARWMPEYVTALTYQPLSEQRDKALRAIEAQTAAFIDAHNHGKLDGIHQHMLFEPDALLPLLFWFSNPAHRPILAQSVLRQFQEGGSILTDRRFENTYLLYRARYGDLPEISHHVHT